jgi:ATP-binding cassette subfamily B protein
MLASLHRLCYFRIKSSTFRPHGGGFLVERTVHVLWQYLRPLGALVTLAMVLAGAAQVLTLIDPVIFGKIIDEYALHPGDKTDSELVRGAVWWLFVAALVAAAAQLAKAFRDYVLRLVVQKFGLQLFNDGLRQTLRLSYQ